MKKFIFLLLVAVIGFVQSYAQSATTFPLVAGDTVVNTGTVSKVIKATAGYSGAVIQVVGKKVSGTVAGTIAVYGSLDGTNYELLDTTHTATNIDTNVKSFYINAPLPTHIKIQWTGSGTMSAQMRVRYVLRKYQN